MKNLSDEELVLNYCISCMEFDRDIDVPPEGVKKNMTLQTELISRLERGRKAIDAMEKAINCRETFLKSEMSVLGDLDMAADNFASSIHKIIEGYQQSCKEAADEQCDRQS